MVLDLLLAIMKEKSPGLALALTAGLVPGQIPGFRILKNLIIVTLALMTVTQPREIGGLHAGIAIEGKAIKRHMSGESTLNGCVEIKIY